MKLFSLVSSALIASSSVLVSQVAFADGWPGNVLGTWTVNANNSVGTLSVTSQATTGQCRAITGSIFGDPIQGFYCLSGRIVFIRKNATTNDTLQVYSANLSQTATGPLKMGGLFASPTNQFGEYNFSATK